MVTSQRSRPTLPWDDATGTEYGSENLDGNEVGYYIPTYDGKGFSKASKQARYVN